MKEHEWKIITHNEATGYALNFMNNGNAEGVTIAIALLENNPIYICSRCESIKHSINTIDIEKDCDAALANKVIKS